MLELIYRPRRGEHKGHTIRVIGADGLIDEDTHALVKCSCGDQWGVRWPLILDAISQTGALVLKGEA